jgi:hypothetical protein
MILKKQRHFLLGLILIAGFFAGRDAGIRAAYFPATHSGHEFSSTAMAASAGQSCVQSPAHDDIRPAVPVVAWGSPHFHVQKSSSRSKSDEKRHKKSLLSPAFAAQFSVPLPRFTYCNREYSFFISTKCIRQTTGNFSLRGPPSYS